jgi:hypothetical protein
MFKRNTPNPRETPAYKKNIGYRFKSMSALASRKQLETPSEKAKSPATPAPALKRPTTSAKARDSINKTAHRPISSKLETSKEVNFKNEPLKATVISKRTPKKGAEATGFESDDDSDGNEHYEIVEKAKVPLDADKRNKSSKNALKRPHTSFAALSTTTMRTMPTRQDRAFVDFDMDDEEKKPKPVEPVKDERYLNLLNSMNSMYKPSDDVPQSKDPFKRVDNLIRRNKALYGRIEYEAEQAKIYKIGTENLKLFERLIAGVW